MVAPQRPFDPGYGPGERIAEIPVPAARLSSAGSLAELAGDFAFVNYGLWYTYGELERHVDPVADIVQENQWDDFFSATLTCKQPIFDGICSPFLRSVCQYNYNLRAIPLPFWEVVREGLLSRSFVDRNKRRFHRATLQELTIIDPRALERLVVLPSPAPTVTVFAYGLDGTHYHKLFEPSEPQVGRRVKVVDMPLNPEAVALGRAILGERDKPFSVLEKPLEPRRDSLPRPKRF